MSHARAVNACIRAAIEQEHREQCEEHRDYQHHSQQKTHNQQHEFDLVATTSHINNNEQQQHYVAGSANVEIGIVADGSIISVAAAASIPVTVPVPVPVVSVGGQQYIARKKDNHWECLRTRYHLLYLKAFELHLWLDGLLRKRNATTEVSAIDHGC